MSSQETIKIGAIFSMTGPASFLGSPEAKTVKMLAEQINAKGGIKGRNVELIIRDSGGDVEKASSIAKELAEKYKVAAIIGPSTTGESMKVKSIAEYNKVPLISCAAAEAIVVPVNKYIFKTPQNDRFAAMKIINQIKKMGLSRIGVLSSSTSFGREGKTQIEKLASQNGIKIIVNEVYNKDAKDLSAVLGKMKTAKVQAVINWSIEPAQAILVRNARQIGITVPIFQSHGFGNIAYVKAAGQAAEGVIFPGSRLLVADILPESNRQKEVIMKYKNDYEAMYREDVSAFGGYAFDALMIIIDAIKKAGADRAAIRAGIENTRDFIGTGGIFNFSPSDHNGLDVNAFEMLTVKNGKFTLLMSSLQK